ncbi:MAG: hypothetical protein GW856_02740 [Cyanobacteria bacterium]|nr:hypothetical protein [Cyanobacteria bacterium CG_2015-16_32_12]
MTIIDKLKILEKLEFSLSFSDIKYCAQNLEELENYLQDFLAYYFASIISPADIIKIIRTGFYQYNGKNYNLGFIPLEQVIITILVICEEKSFEEITYELQCFENDFSTNSALEHINQILDELITKLKHD